MLNLKNKIALITGARRGMGRTHAIALARQGAKVVITDIDQKDCLDVVTEIKTAGGEAIGFRLDVVSGAEVNSVFDEVIKNWGRLDILVNNAGIYTPKSALELTEEDWEETLAVNLKGQFLCAQRAAKEMIKNKWGRIINISSIASGQIGIGLSGGAHYTASKGGIIGLTESLAIEWADFGINVNAIAPGAIDTPMSRSERLSPEEMNLFLTHNVPLKRIGQPEEVSALVVFLASDEASYVTGATFHIDGGWLAL